MKTKILILVWAILPICSFAQEVSVDPLLHEIDSICSSCKQLKNNKDKVSCYEQVLALHDSVYNLMADSVRYFSAFEKDAHVLQFFVRTDSMVFSQNYIEMDVSKLPKYLQEHYAVISTIRQFAECIKNMEEKAKDAEEEEDIKEEGRKKYVALKIESEIDKVNELLDRIDKLNVSSISEEQDIFYQHLSERLTDILKTNTFSNYEV